MRPKALDKLPWGAWALLFFLIAGALVKPRLEGDTLLVMNGANAFAACLAARKLPCPDAGYFPFFQSGIALALRSFSDAWSPRIFALMSAMGFAGLLAAGSQALLSQKRPIGAALFALALAQSPLLWYARSTFLELPAAFLLLAVTLGLTRESQSRRGDLALAALAVLSCLTKEIYPPLLLIWGLLLLPPSGAWRRRGLFFAALASGLALNSLWNQARYGALTNVAMLHPRFLVHDIAQQVRFLVALLASPNGGLLFFWPLALLLISVCAVAGFASSPRKSTAVSLVGGAVLLGLSRWYAPMGWVSWGPRLLLPWLPALLWVTLSATTEARLQRLVQGKRRAWLWLCAIAAVPNAMIMFDRDSFNWFFGTPTAACPPGLSIDTNVRGHYDCVNALQGFWPEHWIQGSVWHSLFARPDFALLAALYLALLAQLIRNVGKERNGART